MFYWLQPVGVVSITLLQYASSHYVILLFTPHFVFLSHPQRQRLIGARVSLEEGGASGEESLGANGQWGRENGTLGEGDSQPLEGDRERGKELGEATGGGAQLKEDEEEEEVEEGEGENAPFKPFALPGEQ